jgi:hypothetical protein
MIKVIWRTSLILGTALSIAVLFYRAINDGWIPGTASRFPFREGRHVESALEGRSDFRASTAPNRNILLFRPEFGDRDFENRGFRAGSSITLGLAEVLRNLSIIALMVGIVITLEYLFRFAQKTILRRS